MVPEKTTYLPTSMSTKIRQSPPLDLTEPYDPSSLKDRVILITGGASGFGAGFVRKWASHGAVVIVGDINVAAGVELVMTVRKETSNDRVHFLQCDVTSWSSQVQFFKEAVRLSPHGGIDTAVANAGIAGPDPLQMAADREPNPNKPPRFKILDVNLTGVVYTVHLAFHYLSKNPGSVSTTPHQHSPVSKSSPRDRHILLLGSIASLGPILGQPQYGASKHAVLGLFRSLRGSSFVHGIRVNLVCPYFIDTPLLPPVAKVLLAGGGTGKVEDVVDAGSRLVANTSIVGRALVIGPKVPAYVDDSGEMYLGEDGKHAERAIWEVHADDWEDVEVFTRRLVSLLNTVETARGWGGWTKDMIVAVTSGVGVKGVVGMLAVGAAGIWLCTH